MVILLDELTVADSPVGVPGTDPPPLLPLLPPASTTHASVEKQIIAVKAITANLLTKFFIKKTSILSRVAACYPTDSLLIEVSATRRLNLLKI
jgi:hypothetical protein